MLSFVREFNLLLAVILTLAYFYQLVYLVIGLTRKKRRALEQEVRRHRYAAVICARNESNVIGDLIRDLKRQNYPAELLDVYVVADNCTDDTAAVSREAGAIVYERFNKTQVGKGYAMDYLFHRLKAEGRTGYDGFFVFDADNHVEPDFVPAMNRTFDSGEYDALTSYRNSKNFGDNWISAGYGLWFLREARFLSGPRMALGTNCHVSGTGFLVAARVIEDNGGWPFHLLTEDIQFSVDCAIQGKRIGYCDKAVVYDEQPTTFRQSWDQRLRWSKGFYQVDREYTLPLLKGCFRRGRLGTSCYDMFVTVAPGMLLTLLMILFNGVILAACLTQPAYLATRIIHETVGFMGSAVWNFYVGLLFYGLITVLSEWRHIDAAPVQKLGYVLTFPIFMFTYIPISIAALVQKVEWKPIYHTATKKINELG